MTFEEVRVDVAEGVAIDWTRMVVEIHTAARGFGVGANPRTEEQQARRQASALVASGAGAIQVTAKLRWTDVQADPALAETLRSRLDLWAVTEARYYTSGMVELRGELPIGELLKPWTSSVAHATAPGLRSTEGPTGLVVDARGSKVVFAWSPQLLAADGTVLWDGRLEEAAAMAASPVIYAYDPDSAVARQRVGDSAVQVKATAVGVDLVVGPADAARLAMVLPVLGQGRTVVLVDP